jgi:alkaline phosphatase D
MKNTLFFILIFVAQIVLAQNNKVVSKIAFGSCANQNANQDILLSVLDHQPDLFIYLGDNIYGDTRDMQVLYDKYQVLGNKLEFKMLRNSTEVLATWDDHDYGKNDAGKNYVMKKESKEIFLNFWKEPLDSERYKHEGIYHALTYGIDGKKVQVILLDTRTFRTPLKFRYFRPFNKNFKNDYRPTYRKNATFLGKEQWLWLEKQLLEPADLRIIASSNQFAHEYNGYESWTNMPLEQEKMLKLIASTQANGVVFISGDVHWGEISKLESPSTYPIFDVTSSGLTQTWHKTENNANRVGEVVPENNFGLIEINWEEKWLVLKIQDKANNTRVQQKLAFYELSFLEKN